MCLRINDVDRVLRQNVISELNYDERGFPESVHEEVKHAIVDDITYYINNHFRHYKDDCKAIVKTSGIDIRIDMKIKSSVGSISLLLHSLCL